MGVTIFLKWHICVLIEVAQKTSSWALAFSYSFSPCLCIPESLPWAVVVFFLE